MIVLDTNVLSELMKPEPSAEVVEWIGKQDPTTLFLTTLTLAEIRFGLAVLPVGKRRTALAESFEHTILPTFGGRVLDFDQPASVSFALLRADARALGHSLSDLDALIAGIARSRGFAIATRDASGFTHAGVDVIDPFTSAA